MTIYHINKGIGRASSGIEYAQKYRYNLVKDFPEKQYFVYTNNIASNYVNFTDKIGIDSTFTMSAYKVMAGQKNHASTLTVEDYESTLSEDYRRIDQTDTFVTFEKMDVENDFQSDGVVYKVWLLPENGNVDRVDVLVNQKLMEVHYYSDRLTQIQYHNSGQMNAAYFYDEEGHLSMRQYYREGNIELTLVDDLVIQGRHNFYSEFFKRLKFAKGDIVLIDRNQDIGDAIFPNVNDAKLVAVVHAEHFSKRIEVEDWVLWNNFYEYIFTNAKYVDRIVVSTEKQEEILSQQFDLIDTKDYAIQTIPVGSISEIADGKEVEKNKYHFLTVSRLAVEKHIDVLIKAVAKAKPQVPELQFSVYGSGKLEKELKDLIEELEAGSYITMEGHKQMADEYEKFGGYLSASGSEGFGLSILEAKGACLPIIGLDVNYGNTTFIQSGTNGYLVEKNEEDQQVDDIADAIVKMTSSLDYKKSIKYDRSFLKDFTAKAVTKKWRELYDELLDGKGK